MRTRGYVTTFLPRKRIQSKKTTFSKRVVMGLLALCACGNVLSYILAFCGLETAEAVTQSLNSVFGAAVIGYLLKSYGEHNSMNKYNVEEASRWNGNE